MRTLVCLLAAPLLAVAAPAPKPVTLTPKHVVGTWSYSWGGFPDGIICFAADGTYSAMHDPCGSVYYAGKWELKGDTVTIFEFAYNVDGSPRWNWETPSAYAFKFDVKGYPTLKGLSNGATPVVLSNPKRDR